MRKRLCECRCVASEHLFFCCTLFALIPLSQFDWLLLIAVLLLAGNGCKPESWLARLQSLKYAIASALKELPGFFCWAELKHERATSFCLAVCARLNASLSPSVSVFAIVQCDKMNVQVGRQRLRSHLCIKSDS